MPCFTYFFDILYVLVYVEVTYLWDKDTNSWKKNNDDCDRKNATTELEHKQSMNLGPYGYERDTHTYTDATDGTVYFWDKGKKAWFPKVS